MPAPIIYSTTGSALTSEEVSFAQQVAASFSLDMNRGWIKIVRRLDPVSGVLVEYHSSKNIAFTTPGGATDYVAMSMPNPIPYRGVSIGVVEKVPSRSASFTHVPLYSEGGFSYYDDYVIVTYLNSAGDSVNTTNGEMHLVSQTGLDVITYVNWPSGYSDPNNYISLVGANDTGALWAGFSGVFTGLPGGGSFTGGWSVVSPSYEATLASDIAAGTGGKKTYVMASDGEVLASEIQNTVGTNPEHTQYVAIETWWPYINIGMSASWMMDSASSTVEYHHKLTYQVPEDVIYPAPALTTPTYPGTDGLTAEWNEDWQAGVTAFNARRKAWFKKNSDEFIAALKTGFAPGAEGVTRAELQLGRLPDAWDHYIKRDVDKKYGSYAPTNTIGRKTKREILYSEVAYSETVESDTSVGLTQAGVRVTKRISTLRYTFGDEVREVVLTGFLTQTVLRHADSYDTQLALSIHAMYDNWYIREATSLPSGVPSVITAQYLKDRTTSRIGAVLNGVVQTGYNADSTLGVPGNPLTYDAYIPPYPSASSTVTATVHEWIEEWHRDSKIVYLKDGVGASNELNDSALHGVKEIHITPIGAVTSESLGIFPADGDAQDATRVELFGTAVYTFDWQTGALTFKAWKPRTNANGDEVASETVDLPAGVTWGDIQANCIITYKGIHWPDVTAALKVRDKTLETSDPSLYTLIQAVKTG